MKRIKLFELLALKLFSFSKQTNSLMTQDNF
jgi:hypothetical protein